MVRVYSSAANHLHHRPYLVKCPEYFTNIPEDENSPFFHPPYDPLNPHAMTRSQRTITEMVYMRANKIPFDIIDDRDVLLIDSEITAYLDEIRGHPVNEDLKFYLQKLLPLRDAILRLKKRVLNLHPDWAHKYRTLDSGYLEYLYNFLQSTDAPVNSFTSPTDAMAHMRNFTGAQHNPLSLSDKIAAEQRAEEIKKNYAINPASVYDGEI